MCPDRPPEHEQAAGGDPASGDTYCDAGPFGPQADNKCGCESNQHEHREQETKQGDSSGLEEAHAGSVQVSMLEAEESGKRAGHAQREFRVGDKQSPEQKKPTCDEGMGSRRYGAESGESPEQPRDRKYK